LIVSLKEIVTSYLDREGIDLVDLNVYRKGSKTGVSILVDKPQGGISIGECAALNQRIGDLLDEVKVIEQSYILEVSSPGLDRPLRTVKDYARVAGREIRILAFQPVNNSFELKGKLVSVNEDSLDIIVEEEQVNIKLDNVKQAKQVI